MKRKASFGLAIAALSFGDCSLAAEPECYDAKVLAKPVAQIPTPFPDEQGYIVISWPWFVDLRLKRVLDGELDKKTLTALAVLHGRFPNTTRTFLLRENDLGSWNILRPEEPDQVPRCTSNSAPMQSFIRPDAGSTLDDYRRASRQELR